MKKMMLALVMLAAIGCGETSQLYYAGTSEGDVEEAGVTEDTSLMLGTRTLWSAPEVNTAEDAGQIRLEAPAPAKAIRVLWTAGVYDRLEYAVEDESGERGAYRALTALATGFPERTSDVILDAPTRAVWFRVDDADVSFAQARFFGELPQGGMYTHPAPRAMTGERDEWMLQGQALALPERYQTPPAILAAAATRQIQVDRAEPGCIGHDTAGALRLKADLETRFPQIARIDRPYVCRSTANGSRSLHARGRALDLFIPTVGSDHEDNGDNTVGDPIANWLIANAHVLGVQSVIWDHSIWTPGAGQREYCQNCWRSRNLSPHNDHIHVGLNLAAAGEETPFSQDPSVITNPPPSDPIGPEPSCPSSSLGRDVPVGTCVQSTSESADRRCKWYTCSETGSWSLLGDMPTGCEAESHPASVCEAVDETPKPELRMRLEWSEETDLDLYVREPSGDLLSFRSTELTANDGALHNETSCRTDDCSNITKPFHEDAVWGELTGMLTSGGYTFWVENYNGRAASQARLIVTRTDAEGQTTFEQTLEISVPGEERAVTSEQTVEVP